MAKRTRPKKKTRDVPPGSPLSPEPEDIPDVRLEIVFAEEVNDKLTTNSAATSASSKPQGK